ncbi:hypothetical protein P3T36_000245 [Kitasatospora sp. MAP12-15]|uniref:hypothetical protein n=1 Tax=unclassified Kitasatospora TaxID=2633591 RepID=UPI002474DD3A|nr:hypothetical protein [Kitasatospora sp. MAP12-44]MDH6109474.1 hypothetical protein [Kitasatospora sp. MAP12-44]
MTAANAKCEATRRDATPCQKDAVWRVSYTAKRPAETAMHRLCCHMHLGQMTQEAVFPSGAISITLVPVKAGPGESTFKAWEPTSYYCDRHQLGPRPGVVPTMHCVPGQWFGVLGPDGARVGDELACAVQAMNNAYAMARYSGQTYVAVLLDS